MTRRLIIAWLIPLICACPGESPPPRHDGAVVDGSPDAEPIPATCGNTVKDPAEECDDGNDDNTDACLNTCKLAYCGDGHMQKNVEECDDGNQIDNDACSLSCRSQEFSVNAITVQDQRYPAVAVQSDSTILVVWQDGSASGGDTSGTTIRLRRFDLKGKALDSTELVLPTTTTKDQRDPAIAVNAQDQALVVWTDWSTGSGDTSGTAVRGRLVGKAGAPVGQDVLINSTTTGSQSAPAVTATPGGFAVVYNDTSIGGSSHGTDVRLRLVSATGQPTGSDKQANSTNQGDQMWPDVAAAPGGNLLVVWQSWSNDDAEKDGIGIGMRLFNPSGSAVTGEKILNAIGTGEQENPRVVFDASGGQFVVVWDDGSTQGADSDGLSIRMRLVSTGGQAGAQESVMNTTTTGSQRHPAVAAATGTTAIVWEDGGQPAQGLDVRARRYGKDATDQLVNTTTSQDQALPAVAVTSSGHTVVVWEGTGATSDPGYGIRMRILAP